MKRIISISRRTDVPAFHGAWFMERVREGVAGYVNPFGGGRYTVSLRPEDVLFIVFWSKDYRPFLRYLDELDERGYRFCFHFTITGHPPELERHTPPWRSAVETAHELARRYSPSHVLWRFDPIVLSSVTPRTVVLETFRSIARSMQGATRRCYVSYVDYYGKVLRNFRQLYAERGVTFRVDTELRDTIARVETAAPGAFVCDLRSAERIELAGDLAAMARTYGISMHSCCEEELVRRAEAPTEQAHCVDRELIGELLGRMPVQAPPKPTRKGCGCFESRDIGAYDTCPHGCIYCYANVDKDLARRRAHMLRQCPHAFSLSPGVERGDFPPLPLPQGLSPSQRALPGLG